MNNYEERKQRRIERLEERAAKKTQLAEEQLKRSRATSSLIPFGQPVLRGHHSERRHLRDIDKVQKGFRKGYELQSEAEKLKERAEAAKHSCVISSQDPEAVKKLRDKLEVCVQTQGIWKEWNRQYRKHKGDISRLDLCQEAIEQIEYRIAKRKQHYPLCSVRQPVQSYELSNNNAEIRRLKKRIEELEKRAKVVERPTRYLGDIEIVDNLEFHKVELRFPDKPTQEIRAFLKRSGFRWIGSVGCWSRAIGIETDRRIEALSALVET